MRVKINTRHEGSLWWVSLHIKNKENNYHLMLSVWNISNLVYEISVILVNGTPPVGYYRSLYYMAQVTSRKIVRCDWLLAWQDFSVMTAGITKIVNALVNKNKLKILKK